MAHDQESHRSVLDIIYVDNNRISLYLSQFSEFGNLTSLVRSVQEEDKREAGVDVKIASAKTSEGQQTAIHKHYDTQWVAPLTFLEELQARRMIKRNSDDARIGDIILLSGRLSLIDMKAFERTWNALPGESPRSSPPQPTNRHDRRAQAAQGRAAPAPAPSVDGLRILGSLDQPLFLNFVSQDKHFWSNALSDCVIGDSKGLALKHGHSMAGEWYVLAILDCLPDDSSSTSMVSARVCGDEPNIFGEQVTILVNQLKSVMGRPSGCYGITPLVIFREIL